MLIELVDDLRCPRPHEDSWLVAAAERTDGREIVEGTLGCPVCHAEYPIRRGVVRFSERAVEAPKQTAAPRHVDLELAMRLAAFLDLSDAHGFALLAGSWAAAAHHLRNIVPPHFVVLNPIPEADTASGISVLEIGAGIPLAAGTCRGVALDEAHADGDRLDAAVRVLRPHGRLVAPASTSLPSGVSELARDEQLWVAERGAAPPRLVSLQPRTV